MQGVSCSGEVITLVSLTSAAVDQVEDNKGQSTLGTDEDVVKSPMTDGSNTWKFSATFQRKVKSPIKTVRVRLLLLILDLDPSTPHRWRLWCYF